MLYNFIEIGSYWCDTLIEKAGPSDRGITIEPIREYLDRLPDKKSVVKLAVAVVPHPVEDLDLYYVDQTDIRNHGLHSWIAQCNSLSNAHPWHVNYFANADGTGKRTNLFDLGIVKTRKVPCMTYRQICERFDVTEVELLKIDTEGYDCKIVNSMIDYCLADSKPFPRKIQFETNSSCTPEEIDQTRSRLLTVGYQNKIAGADTISTLIAR